MSIPIDARRTAAAAFHPDLEETAARAGAWHAGQTDKAGAPYLGHLIRVSQHLRRLFPDTSLAERHAAWLHDVLEDTAATADDLRAFGYAEEVIAIVEAVTRRQGEQRSYADWIETIAEHAPTGAIRVKLADLTDNSDPDRLAALPPDRAAALGSRYRAAIARLRQALAARTLPSDKG